MASQLINDTTLEDAYIDIVDMDFGETLTFQQLVNDYHIYIYIWT